MDSAYQHLALFLLGTVASGAVMLLRGDFMGRKAAEEVEIRLNSRIDREMAMILNDLREIKDALVRMERDN